VSKDEISIIAVKKETKKERKKRKCCIDRCRIDNSIDGKKGKLLLLLFKIDVVERDVVVSKQRKFRSFR
jgi:hypothetical protein